MATESSLNHMHFHFFVRDETVIALEFEIVISVSSCQFNHKEFFEMREMRN